MAGTSISKTRSVFWQPLLLLAGLSACTLSACSAATSRTNGNGNGNGGNGNGNGGNSSTPGGGASTSGAAGTTGNSTTCQALPTLPRRLWRLSVEQYQQAVKDLLQLPAAPVLTNRGGEAQWAFFSDASLRVDDSFQYALYEAIESILPTIPASVTACQSGEAATACATRIATSFGAKAFRRPLSQAEITALVSAPAQPASGTTAAVSAAPFLSAGTDTQTGIKLMLEAILLSPSFVYRTELGPSTLTADASGNYPPTTLTPYEVATQLAFTFLGSTPDAALEAAAADTSANGLGSVTGIQAQVDRLLALPAVKGNLTTIVAGWFNIGQLFLKTHDTSFLSKLSAADQADQTGVQGDLYTSAQTFITDALWTKAGKITDLLGSTQGFFNSRLAALYPEVTFANGAPTSLTTFVAGTWPASEQRVGLLTDPSYFWAQSDPAANSIVKRGKAMHDDIICADAIPQPPDLTSPALAAIVALGDSEITKSDARLTHSPCNGCHTQMDPYSRVLQHFGPIGNYRTVDEAGRPIDTSVTFSAPSPLAPQTIADPKAFASGLVASGKVSDCAVQKMSSYLIGSMIDTFDTCEVDAVRKQFAQTDGSLASLFKTVVVADFVRARAGGAK
ncbi:MAG TPA: DUF1592 domain-containing protein [Polyangiaceae bacterium]